MGNIRRYWRGAVSVIMIRKRLLRISGVATVSAVPPTGPEQVSEIAAPILCRRYLALFFASILS